MNDAHTVLEDRRLDEFGDNNVQVTTPDHSAASTAPEPDFVLSMNPWQLYL